MARFRNFWSLRLGNEKKSNLIPLNANQFDDIRDMQKIHAVIATLLISGPAPGMSSSLRDASPARILDLPHVFGPNNTPATF